MNQKGFLQTAVILVVLVLATVGATGCVKSPSSLNNDTLAPVTPTPTPTPTPPPPPTPTPIPTPPPTRATRPVNNTESGAVGMLSVVAGCMIPEGCGPKYTLWDSEFKSATPLLGDIKDKDLGLIIRVVGKKTTLPSSEYGDINYRGTTKAISVSSYSVLSKIPYHDFLVDKAGEYTLQKYPCLASEEYGRVFTKYNKTFLWGLIGSTPVIKVRMTDTLSGVKPEAFYELWYNGNSGDFIKEVDEPKGKIFCQ